MSQPALSRRQRLALEHAADGLTLPEIAEQMGIRVGTVNSHLYGARLKLNARNTTHAVAIAVRFRYVL